MIVNYKNFSEALYTTTNRSNRLFSMLYVVNGDGKLISSDSVDELIQFAKDENATRFAIYNKDYSSVSDVKNIVKWYDTNGLIAKLAKENPELYNKAIEEWKGSDVLRKLNNKTGIFENIKTFQNFNESSYDSYPYFVEYQDGNGFNGKYYAYYVDTLIEYCKDRNCKRFAIYQNDIKMHSVTQEEFLVKWYDSEGNTYWSNRAKKEPKLYKKCLNPIKSSDKLRNADDKTGVFEKSDWKVRDLHSNYTYIMNWLDVSVTKKRGDNSVEELIKYAKKNDIKSFAIYKNIIGLNYSKTKDLVCWSGDNNHFATVAKEDPTVWQKHIDVIKQSNKLRKADDKTGIFENTTNDLSLLKLANDVVWGVENKKEIYGHFVKFIKSFCNKYGTHADQWMTTSNVYHLAKKYVSGEYDFKTRITDGLSKENDEDLHNSWKLFEYEEYDMKIESILYRLKMFNKNKILNANKATGIFENIDNIYIIDLDFNGEAYYSKELLDRIRHELPITDNDIVIDLKFVKMLKKYNLKTEIIEQSGDLGWPVIRFIGSKYNLIKFLENEYNEDESYFEDYAEFLPHYNSDKLKNTNNNTGIFENVTAERHLEILEAANDLIKNPKDFNKLETFLILFGQTYGTNLENWMDKNHAIELATLYAFDEYDFKTITDDKTNRQRASAELKSGWKILVYYTDTEHLENITVETILYRHKMFQSDKLLKTDQKTGIFENLLYDHSNVLNAAKQTIDKHDYSSISNFMVIFCKVYGSTAKYWMSTFDGYNLAKLYIQELYDFKTIKTIKDLKDVVASEKRDGWTVFISENVDDSDDEKYDNKVLEIILYRNKLFQSNKILKIDQKTGIFED